MGHPLVQLAALAAFSVDFGLAVPADVVAAVDLRCSNVGVSTETGALLTNKR